MSLNTANLMVKKMAIVHFKMFGDKLCCYPLASGTSQEDLTEAAQRLPPGGSKGTVFGKTEMTAISIFNCSPVDFNEV